MDDWQEAAFNNRRIPHGRGARGGSRKGGGTFDPRRTYGVYELQGSAIERALALGEDEDDSRSSKRRGGGGGGNRAILEIHGLTDSGDGLVASIQIGRAMKGMAILAGSRRTLERNVRDMTAEEEEEEEEDRGRGRNYAGSGSGSGSDENGDEEEDDDGEDRANVFEKNTFRSPKFWLQWRATVAVLAGTNTVNTEHTSNSNARRASASSSSPLSPSFSPSSPFSSSFPPSFSSSTSSFSTSTSIVADDSNNSKPESKTREKRGKGSRGTAAAATSNSRSTSKSTPTPKSPTFPNSNQTPWPKTSTKLTTKGDTDTGYLVFAGNDCTSFQATIKFPVLGWKKNAAVTGRKVTGKGKGGGRGGGGGGGATDCPVGWTDVVLE